MKLTLLLLPVVIFLFVAPVGAQTQTSNQSSAEKYFGDIVLVDQDGQERRLFTDLMKDKTIVVQAFLATCKSACPVVNAQLKKLQEAAGDKLGKDAYLLSITLDTQTDTPARLKEYADKSKAKPGWFFLSGKQENVDAALKKFGLFVEKKEDHGLILIIGNVRTGLWKKAYGLSKSSDLITVLESVMNDPGQ